MLTNQLSDDVAIKYMPMVTRLARGMGKRVGYSSFEHEDLVGSGAYALVNHYRKHGGSEYFEKTLSSAIWSGMIDFVRSQDPLPRSHRKSMKRAECRRQKMEQEECRLLPLSEVGHSVLPLVFVDIESVQIKYEDSAFDNIERSECVEMVAKCVQSLPPEHRVVMGLLLNDGMTVPEVALCTGMSSRKVRSIKELSIGKIRRMMKNER